MSATAVVMMGLAMTVAQPKVTAEQTGDKYTIDVSETTNSIKPGKAGKFVLHIKAAPGYKVSKDAPLKVKLASEGVALSKSQLKAKDATDPKFTSPMFKVPFQAKDKGETAIAMDASFFVCDVKICERKTAKLSVPVSVRP